MRSNRRGSSPLDVVSREMPRRMLFVIPVLLAATSSWALSWDITTVDGPGDVGAYASIALDPLGSPGISYCASSSDDLKFARFVDGIWQVELVDATGRTGWYTSLAFDSAGSPRIAYWDLTNSALRYARWTGSSWATETVDNSAYVGQCCSLALDSADNPGISYYDYTNGDLRYAKWNGATWLIEVVDSGPPQLGAGLYTSLVLDSMDRPRISYADHTLGQLRYAWWDGTSWILEVVDGGTPIGTSIQLDAAGVPHISYAHQFGQGSHLKYAERSGPGGTWQTQIVRPGGQMGWYSSLRLRADGAPRILSWDLGNGIVDYDSYDAGGWVHDTVETMGYTDQWCSLALDSAGRPLAAYRSATEQDLHYAVGTDPAAVPETADTDPSGSVLTVYPSPVREGAIARLRLEGPSVIRVSIYDVLGREISGPIERRVAGGSAEIPLPRILRSGVYFVRAETSDGDYATRFVRSR